MKSEGSLVY